MSALEIRNRVRLAAAQSAWDNAPEVCDDEDDELWGRRNAITEARLELDRAERLLNAGRILQCDQAMADAAGYLL
jgi:hypothetical protein